MMNDSLISGVPNFVFIILGVLVIALIIVIVLIKKKNNSSKTPDVSILDVNNSGVPNSSESQEFSYGYEKEQTVVMNSVNENDNPSEVQPEMVQNPSAINAAIPEAPIQNNESFNQLNSAIPDSAPVEQVNEEPANINSNLEADVQLNNVEPVTLTNPVPEVSPIMQESESITNITNEPINSNVVEPQAKILEQMPSDMESIPIPSAPINETNITNNDQLQNVNTDSINQ